jgi:glycerophosphoryl diester phosphodiesterase
MKPFEIVAHRGIPTEAPENTIESFQRAIDLGADGVELDVRLTADRIPVVYHYYYLDVNTTASGAIFNYTFEQLKDVKVLCKDNPAAKPGRISTLCEILDIFSGKIGLEIEIKGPEPEVVEIIGNVLHKHKALWDTMEVTSYHPSLLTGIQNLCPGLATDFLFPRSEDWMTLDVVQYQAIHLSRLAHARAVHLHPSQLSETVVNALHEQGLEIHTWDTNDEQTLTTIANLGIPRVCTDNFKKALAFRDKLFVNLTVPTRRDI